MIVSLHSFVLLYIRKKCFLSVLGESFTIPESVSITTMYSVFMSGFYCATTSNATHGIANAFLSICLSVCLSNVCFSTKQKKLVPTFLYHMKDHSPQFCDKKNGWWGVTPSPSV